MKKYDYHLEILEHWSPGLAYVLGLALTDGSVNKDLTRISLYSTDQQMLVTLLYQDSKDLGLERKYHQWLKWNQHFKLMTNCLFCDVSLRASKGEKFCPSCRVIRNRLMNRRSYHYRRKGIWMSLRDLCKREEHHLPVERLDLSLE